MKMSDTLIFVLIFDMKLDVFHLSGYLIYKILAKLAFLLSWKIK